MWILFRQLFGNIWANFIIQLLVTLLASFVLDGSNSHTLSRFNNVSNKPKFIVTFDGANNDVGTKMEKLDNLNTV